LGRSNVEKQIAGTLVQMNILEDSVLPPDGLCRSMYDEAKKNVNYGVGMMDQLTAFIDVLNDGSKFAYKPLMDHEGISISAITFHDKRMTPPVGTSYAVLTGDVTFGIIPPSSGFEKSSYWTALTPDHKAHILTTTVLKHEDSRTFVHEIEFLLEMFPEIEFMAIVVILDGDSAKFLAVRTKLKLAVIILCLYHSSENFKKRFGAAGKSYRKGAQIAEDDIPVYYAKCVTCSRYREVGKAVLEDVELMQRVVCSDLSRTCEEDSDDITTTPTDTTTTDTTTTDTTTTDATPTDTTTTTTDATPTDATTTDATTTDATTADATTTDTTTTDATPTDTTTTDTTTTDTTTTDTTTTDATPTDATPTDATTTDGTPTTTNATPTYNTEAIIFLMLKASVCKKEWHELWSWLRSAPSIAQVKERLDLVVSVYPASATYCKFLWDNVSTWANCVSTGRLTFCYDSSSHQESIFASLKAPLQGKFVGLHRLPDHIRDVSTTCII